MLRPLRRLRRAVSFIHFVCRQMLQLSRCGWSWRGLLQQCPLPSGGFRARSSLVQVDASARYHPEVFNAVWPEYNLLMLARMIFLLSAVAVISLHFVRRATMTPRNDLDMADQAQLPENGTNKQDNRKVRKHRQNTRQSTTLRAHAIVKMIERWPERKGSSFVKNYERDGSLLWCVNVF